MQSGFARLRKQLSPPTPHPDTAWQALAFADRKASCREEDGDLPFSYSVADPYKRLFPTIENRGIQNDILGNRPAAFCRDHYWRSDRPQSRFAWQGGWGAHARSCCAQLRAYRACRYRPC